MIWKCVWNYPKISGDALIRIVTYWKYTHPRHLHNTNEIILYMNTSRMSRSISLWWETSAHFRCASYATTSFFTSSTDVSDWVFSGRLRRHFGLSNRILSYIQYYFTMSIYIFFNVYINTKLTNTRIHNKTRKHTIL